MRRIDCSFAAGRSCPPLLNERGRLSVFLGEWAAGGCGRLECVTLTQRHCCQASSSFSLAYSAHPSDHWIFCTLRCVCRRPHLLNGKSLRRLLPLCKQFTYRLFLSPHVSRPHLRMPRRTALRPSGRAQIHSTVDRQ